MHASHMLATVAALATAAAGLAIRNKHVADFRLFGQPGCSRDNEGIWTVIDDDFRPGECKSMRGILARSIRNVDTNRGCTLSFYTDEACSAAGRRRCGAGECCDSNAAQGWKAWSMVC
ncbi:hypothetical protein E4U41_000100 [Claviceps citrina]|nr:hypothetical protein E4U41_000100 [Claviceps citrina]